MNVMVIILGDRNVNITQNGSLVDMSNRTGDVWGRIEKSHKYEMRDNAHMRDVRQTEWRREFKDKVHGPWHGNMQGWYDLPREQGARPKSDVIPYRPDPRGPENRNRGKALPWGPGPEDKIIDNDDTSRVGKFPTKAQVRQKIVNGIDVARRNNQINKMLDLIDLLGTMSKIQHPDSIPDVKIDGYIRCDGPYSVPPEHLGNQFWFASGSLHCTDFQLGGQGYGSGEWVPPNPVPDGVMGTHVVGIDKPEQFMLGYPKSDYSRWAEHSSWYREGSATPGGVVIEVSGSSTWAFTGPQMRNPNLVRVLPNDPQPMPAPVYDIAPASTAYTWPEFAAQTMSGAAQRYALQVPDHHAFAMSSGSGRRSPPVVKAPVVNREPPKRGEKQKKALSNSARIGIAIFKALDKVSEGADVVDAVWEALPADVKKRWKCNRKAGPVDTFGQYGISNADCKLRALYYNADKIDVAQAAYNIVKNELEDQVYGFVHKRMPKQAGGDAMDGSWKAFGDAMKAAGF